MKRVCAAIVLAIPIAWVATGFADHSGWRWDGLLMCLISPGFPLSVKLAPRLPIGNPADLLDAIARIGLTTVTINFIYYAAVCYGVLTSLLSLIKNANPQSARLSNGTQVR